jgi:hypothetical protein
VVNHDNYDNYDRVTTNYDRVTTAYDRGKTAVWKPIKRPFPLIINTELYGSAAVPTAVCGVESDNDLTAWGTERANLSMDKRMVGLHRPSAQKDDLRLRQHKKKAALRQVVVTVVSCRKLRPECRSLRPLVVGGNSRQLRQSYDKLRQSYDRGKTAVWKPVKRPFPLPEKRPSLRLIGKELCQLALAHTAVGAMGQTAVSLPAQRPSLQLIVKELCRLALAHTVGGVMGQTAVSLPEQRPSLQLDC